MKAKYLKIIPAFFLAALIFGACGDFEDCIVTYSFASLHEFDIETDSVVETFHEHEIHALAISIDMNITPGDTNFVPADTTISDQDTTIVPADTLVTQADTSIASSSIVFVAKNEHFEDLEEEFTLAVGDTAYFGNREMGYSYNYIRIVCDKISPGGDKATLKIWESRYQEDCSSFDED